MAVILTKVTAASEPNAPAGTVDLFADSADGLVKTKDSAGTVATLVTSPIANALLATMPPATIKGNTGGTSSSPIDLTTAQVTAMLNPATSTLPGNMTAAFFNFINLFSTTVYVLATANAYSNIVADGATNDTTAFQALLTNAPDAATIVLPGNNAQILINAALSIPAGRHYNIVAGGGTKCTIVQCSQTADHFTVGDWYSTFTNVGFASANVTTTASQTLTSGTVLTTSALTAGQLALVATSGSITVGSTNTGVNGGWQTLTYSARTATTVTLSQTGTGSSVIGIPLVYKTAGAAINAGNLVGIDAINCSFTCVFNGYVCSGSTSNQSTISQNSFLNTINFDMQIDGANWNGIIDENTCDCTSNSRTLSHLEINQCGSMTGSGNQLIRGQYDCRLGSTTAAYPAGVFGVFLADTFFDNAGIDAVKVQGISAVQRVKFTSCWLSSAQGGMGLNLASTASTLPTDITLIDCNVYSNSTNGIGGNGAQDLSIHGCQIAGNTTAGLNSFVPRLYVKNNRVGPIGGIGANGTGVILPAGAYTAIDITGNDCTGNTTAFTDSSTSATWKQTTANNGINPKTVTTPAVPATTVAITNTTGVRVTAWIKDATPANITAIVIGGTSVATAVASATVATPVVLEPNQTISMTFTTAPTWVWTGS